MPVLPSRAPPSGASRIPKPASLPVQLLVVVVALVSLVVWYAWPALTSGGLLGAPQTDIIRAVWGLDHAWQSVPWPPFWTGRMAFPVGVKIVLLPQFSTVAGSPLVGLFGPVFGFDLWIVGMWAAAGLGSAFLAWRVTGSPAAALLAGVVMVVQPMLFLALSDGTAEFVAWWSVPVALGAVYTSGHLRPSAGRPVGSPYTAQLLWALAAGALLGIVAIDSPYHAIFCAPFVPLVFGWKSWRRQGPMVVTLVASGLVLRGLYYGLPLSAPNDNAPGNAVSLRVWQQWETHAMVRDWDYTLGTGFIPWHVLAGLLACAALRPIRALPWVLVGLLALVWGLNTHPENTPMLKAWLGPSGANLGGWISWFNAHAAPPVIRFPRRWLVPAAQAVAIAAAIGVTRLPKEWMRWLVVVPICVATVQHTEALTRFRANLPRFTPPAPAFATFIADSEEGGAVMFLPRLRGARQAAGRTELPVFAEISRDISSADQLWLQVLCARGSTYWPDGLRTVVRRNAFDKETDRVLHALDDMANPQTTGAPIPPSSTEEPERRARAAASLVERGLSFVAVDEKTYAQRGLELVRSSFAGVTLEERHFDDGTGVTVLVLGEK